MKILFLDIDGVLCINFTKGTPHRNTDKYGDYFDPLCVQSLKQIIDQTGASIVISSTWRMAGLDTMVSLWKDRELPGTVVSITPRKLPTSSGWSEWGTHSASRGEEIDEWLGNNVWDSFCIIDDDTDMMKYQLPFFVRTETHAGLTPELANKAISILNTPSHIK
jgi:hypothetical protein